MLRQGTFVSYKVYMEKEYCTCPSCKNIGYMTVISERKGGYSGGKAAAGVILFGPIGLVGGAFGKRIKTIECPYCGYKFEK